MAFIRIGTNSTSSYIKATTQMQLSSSSSINKDSLIKS